MAGVSAHAAAIRRKEIRFTMFDLLLLERTPLAGIHFGPENDYVTIRQVELLSVSRWRAVFCEITFEGYLHPGFDGVFPEAAPEQVARRSGFEFPVDHFAAVVFHVHVDPRVWIDHIELGHGPAELDRLVAIVFGGEGMVRPQRDACEHQNESGHRDCEPEAHAWSPLLCCRIGQSGYDRRGVCYFLWNIKVNACGWCGCPWCFSHLQARSRITPPPPTILSTGRSSKAA